MSNHDHSHNRQHSNRIRKDENDDSTSPVPLEILNNPFNDESEITNFNRGRSPSQVPILTLNTDVSPTRSQNVSIGAASYEEENLSAITNKSPVSSFFHKLTSTSNTNSFHERLSPNLNVSNMVPYIKTPEHSKVRTDTSNSARNSLLLEDADPDVINRGLKMALGDNLGSMNGLWLPVSPEQKQLDGSDEDNSDAYDDAPDPDEQEQEGIPLADLSLNVPTYPEYLITTTAAPNNVPHVNEDVEKDHVTFDKDIEDGLRVSNPMSQQPKSPGYQLSSAFKKFSARVNGRDYDDDENVLRRSNISSDTDYESDEEEFDQSQNSIFLDPRRGEGSSESYTDINNTTITDKKDIDLKSPKVVETDDNESIATSHSIDFERIGPNSTEKEKHAKEGIRLFGNSLKWFTPQSRFRLMCSSIVFKSWFGLLVTLLTFLQTALLSYQQWNPEKTGYYFRKSYTNIDWVLFVINVFHTVESVFKIVTYGLVDDSQMFKELNIPNEKSSLWNDVIKFNYQRFKKGKKKHTANATHLEALDELRFDPNDKFLQKRPLPIHSVTAYELEDTLDYSNVPYTRAYLRSSWNRIDFLSCISFWLSFFLSFNQYDLKHHIMIFRSLMCLRILRLTNFTHGTSVILKAVKKASPELLDIALLLGSFWVLFAIVGVQSFKSSLRRNCVWFNPNDASDYYVNDSQYCGSYLEAGTLKPMPYVYNDGTPASQIKGFRCPANSKCVSNQNPYGNSVSFDNIANSFELVFVIMSANTFTDLMYDTMDSDSMAAALFYIFGIFCLTVWVVNLLIAVIVNAFTITRDEAILQRKKNKKPTYLNFRNKMQYNDFRKKSKKLKWYYIIEPVFLIVIIISLIAQCWRRDSSSPAQLSNLRRIEEIISLILLLEIIARFCCFLPNWRFFFHSKQNIFDLIVAIITSVMAIPVVNKHMGRSYPWLSVFQIARWYRIVLFIGSVRDIWLKVLGHFKTIFDLSLFFFIFLYLTSIILSRFFEGTISRDALSDTPLAMNSLPNSFISLYTITSTENWTTVLYALQQYAKNKSQQFFGAAFLIVWFMFSNMIILNIFVAVISENLSIPESEKRKEQINQYLQQLRRELKQDLDKGILSDLKDRILASKNATKHNTVEEIWYLLLSGKVQGITDEELNRNLNQETQKVTKRGQLSRFFLKNTYLKSIGGGVVSIYETFKNNPFFSSRSKHKRLVETHDIGNAVQGMIDDDKQLAEQRNDFLKKNPTFNTVLYMLPPNHRLRRFCQKIVPSSKGDRIDGVNPNRTVSFAFSIFMFLITSAMVVVACYATPLYKKKHSIDTRWDWLTNLDLACTLLFSAEFLIKIFADGLIYTPNAYLTSSWNIIDLIVLLTLWINLIFVLRGSASLSSLINGFNALRALRLLTLSTRAKSTFQNTVIAGFWQILNAATISVSLLFPFAIWGLNLFNGRLGYCIDGSSTKDMCYGEFQSQVFKWNIVSPNAYVEPPLHLNNFRSSLLSLFEIISLEGWVDLLENAMNSTGIGTVPSTFATPLNGLFVVLFNFISTVFILTLFVSVIIQNYARGTGRAYQTKEQSAWYEVEKILKQVKASKRGDVEKFSALQLICHKLIIQKNRNWQLFINFNFILHTISLLLEVYPSISALDTTRYVVFVITTSLFLVQLHLMIIARGLKNFLSSPWNRLSVVIVYGAFITSVISFFVSRDTAYANINKTFLVGILLLMIPRIDRLDQLLRYALASLPSLASLLYTWGILFLVYAIALNQIFGLTRTGPDTSNNINTRTVTKTLILLFRMSFGEGWNYIMNDYTVVAPFCQTSDNIYLTDCGNKTYAYLLFISWNILSMFIFLNMFVSLIVDSFSYIYHASDPHSYITRAERRKFKQSWLKFDPYGTGYIKPADLQSFLSSLSGVLSYKIYNDGRFTIPELTKQWFKRVDEDPYSVFIDYPAMNATLGQIDPVKVMVRRLKYERLVQEILMEMKVNNHPGISFTSVILKVALYAHFEDNKCLTLNDFMKRYVFMEKVDAALRHQKIYDTLKTVVARWRYKKGQYENLVDSAENEALQNFEVFGVDTPKPPLIFISEYLRSEESIANSITQNRAATSSSSGDNRNNNVVYDESIDDPFMNPFGDEIGEEITLAKPETKEKNLDLHFRSAAKSSKDHLNGKTKEARNLTASSSALSEAPIINFKPPIITYDRSLNNSKDSLYSDSSTNALGDSETDSLLSIDLSSPRR